MEDEEYYEIIDRHVKKFYKSYERVWHKHKSGGSICCRKCINGELYRTDCSFIGCQGDPSTYQTYGTKLVPLPEMRVSVYFCKTCFDHRLFVPERYLKDPILDSPKLKPDEYEKYKKM